MIMNLEPFSRVQMEVPSCMLSLAQGTEFAVEYQLSNAYEVTTLCVENDTFFFRCKHRYPNALFHWDWKKNYVCVTVPPDVLLTNVSLNNTSGPIEVGGIRATQMEAHNVSGHINLVDVSAGLLLVKATSGAQKLINCGAGEMEVFNVSGGLTCEQLAVTGGLRAKTTSGGIRIAGEVHSGMDLSSTSGSIHSAGQLQGNLQLQTTSGSIEMDLDCPMEEYSYSLHTVSGARKINGQKADSAFIQGAPNGITARSVSGSVKLNFLK